MAKASCGLLAPMYSELHKSGLRPAGVAAAVVSILLLPGTVAAQSLSEIEKARAAVIADGDLQLQLPSGTEPPDGWNFSLLDIHIPPALLWGILAAGVLAIVFYLLKDTLPSLLRAGEGNWQASALERGKSESRSAVEAMQAADELARQGRYVEAMHMLLLKSLADMRQYLSLHIAESLTSREILRKVVLSDAGRAALRDIVARVEWTYFGEHEAGASDYEACRGRFDELTRALQDGQTA
jgi:hypothetical protein